MVHLVRRAIGGTCDLSVDVIDPDAEIGELATAIGLAPPPGADVVVDGVAHRHGTPIELVGICDGSAIGPACQPRASALGPLAGTRVVNLAQVAGVGAGTSLPLAAGRYRIGSDPRRPGGLTAGPVDHTRFELTVRPDGSVTVAPTAGPLRLDGVAVTVPSPVGRRLIDCRDAAFRIATTDVAATSNPELGPGVGPSLFNRPPREMPVSALRPLEVPDPPDSVADGPPLSVIAMVAPLPIGIVMAIVMNPFYVLFMLMSPVMMFGRWVEGRRRTRAAGKHNRAEVAATLGRLEAALDRLRNHTLTERRDHQPDPVALVERATSSDRRLWERRSQHDDFLRLGIGIGEQAWSPPLTGADTYPGLDERLAGGRLPAAPVAVDLAAGTAIGIAGPRPIALALARQLVVGACVLHGPADLALFLLTEPPSAAEWDWLKWLPHLVDDGGRRRVATDPAAGAGLLAELEATDESRSAVRLALGRTGDGPFEADDRVGLLVVDGCGHVDGRGSLARHLLVGRGKPCRAIVLAPSVEGLPAVCTTIVRVDRTGAGVLTDPATRTATPLLAACLPTGVAERAARALARHDDPDRGDGGAEIPTAVGLLDLLGCGTDPSVAAIVERWRAGGTDPPVRAPVGIGDSSALNIDLVADGPHALVAGTTGAGKSELLRSLIASLACSIDPEHLNFVLVDFKGGGAFDACGGLPHTVAVVTDLDEHLSARALRCLKAELHHRERLLRDAGASDIAEYLTAGNPPLARLVVIVDEFATLAAELPDFLTSLVDVAQRGRSLGIHLILATQRPSGVLDNKIRANTNLRIALRVQDDADSIDVIGTPAAARLQRDQAGRGYVRLGAAEVHQFQTALVTGTTGDATDRRAFRVEPFALVPDTSSGETVVGTELAGDQVGADGIEANAGPSDLERIVEAVTEAATSARMVQPRLPWPDPLPDTLAAESFVDAEPEREWAAPLGLADRPDDQRQDTHWWDAAAGNLLVYGVDPIDTTQALATIGLGLAHRRPPDDLHLYVLDFGTGALAPLGELPHTGGYVRADDDERAARLVDLLEREIAGRRALVGAHRLARIESDTAIAGTAVPLTVLLIENYAALVDSFEEGGRLDLVNRVGQVFRDGPAVGVVAVTTTNNERGIPLRVANQVEHKLLLRLADRNGFGMFGIRPTDVPALGPGRGIDLVTGLEVQLGRFAGGDVAAAVADIGARHTAAAQAPPPVRVLPTEIGVGRLDPVGTIGEEGWLVPLGISSSDLSTASLILPAGDHAIVTGPARSGKSTLLATIAASVAAIEPAVRIVGVAPRRSPLRWSEHLSAVFTEAVDGIAARLTEAAGDGPTLVLVDDADTLPSDLVEALKAMATERDDRRKIVAAARPEEFRNFQSWTAPLKASRTGVALRPSPADGELFRSALPMRGPQHYPAGRGFLVTVGVPDLTQFAQTPVQQTHAVAAPHSKLGAPATPEVANAPNFAARRPTHEIGSTSHP